jgi:cell wall integrity and stress response component
LGLSRTRKLTGCAGGGIDFWTIYHTGIVLSVKSEESPKKSTTSDTPKATQTSSTPQQTIVVTESPTSQPESEGSSGPNVAGIAAGVVVGVVVIAAALGGAFLYMRRKRNMEIEEEHRRNAAVNAFIGKPPRSSGGTSTTDSRMDPVMAHRRMSDGSIADNQDYSRRILRVCSIPSFWRARVYC